MRWPLGATPALALSLLLLLAGGNARAETVVATGATGSAGLPGASGDPATDGGQGGTGESVSATADALGEDNLAQATGGDGGPGGDGGDASDPTQPAGAGGLGGSGGDATASAHTQGATSATAIAHGGRISNEGRDGDGQDPVPPPPGIPPSSGGDAVATATLDYQGGLDAQVRAEAIGGGGVPRIFFPFPPPPPSGGTSGDATATAHGTAGTGALLVEAEAHTRFDGAGEPTAGGAASATAYGANQGPGAVEVTAHASSIVLGASPNLVSVGPVEASAEGHSASGDVTVTAIVESGPVTGGGVTTGLHDAVSGSTAGHLTLRQQLHAVSGDVETSLVATNPGGGSLALEVSATPFLPSVGLRPALGGSADVRLGDIIGTSEAGADVSIDVVAAAASLPDNGAPAATVLQLKDDGEGGFAPSVIHGASSGGDVRVEATFRAGAITQNNFDGGPGADGGSVDMLDAVSGETPGHLWLGQEARGGGGQPGLPFPVMGTEGGDGGAARSVLTHHGSSASLTLVSEAFGGRAGSAPLSFGPTQGGAASSVVEATNHAGSVDVLATARGGDNGAGGDAVVEAHARSTGDGHAVRILARRPGDPPFGLDAGARGGDGRQIIAFSADASDGDALGDGGDATSHSTGIAEGDSEVEVFDLASGGAGGTSRRPSTALLAGDGGDASSTAVARSGGASAVAASANAFGGLGGGGLLGAGRGGDASANASARGLGHVEATATAVAGAGGAMDPDQPVAPAGTARATAHAAGASGFAHALSVTGGEPRSDFGFIPHQSEARLGAIAHAAVSSQVAVLSESGVGAAAPPLLAPGEFAARSFVSARPLAGDVQAAIDGNAALAAALADGSRRVLGIASWDARASGGVPAERSISLDITLPTDQPHGVGLAVFDVSFLGNGFQSLGFRLERDGAAVGQETVFSSVEALLAHFADVVLELGPATGDTRFQPLRVPDPSALRAIFDLTLGEGDAFGMRVAYVVPEPSTGALLGLALVALGLRRRRTRA